MFADVIVDRPVDSILTYSVPPSLLSALVVGNIVQVPVGRIKCAAVVLRLTKRPPRGDINIRPIVRALNAGTPVTDTMVQLAKEMAKVSGQPLGSCIFRLLPPRGKQLKKRLPLTLRETQQSSTFRELHLIAPQATRLNTYVKLAQQLSRKNRQSLLIAPIWLHEQLAQRLALLNVPAIRVSGETAAGQQRRIAQDFSLQKYTVLIGSRHVIGWPARSLGGIFIENIYDRGLEDDQQPYIDASTIAWLRAKIERATIILGGSLPTPAMRRRQQTGVAQRIRTPLQTLPITVTRASATRLPPTVQSLLLSGQRVAVICPRHGTGGTAACQECGTLVHCPHCKGILNIEDPNKPATCYDCQSIYPLPERCTKCKSPHLVVRGVGTKSVTQTLTRQLGVLPKTISIGTEQLLRGTSWEYIVFVAADSPLIAPSLTRSLQYLAAIRNAASSAQRVIVFTRSLEQPFWQLLGQQADAYIDTLIDARRKAGLPPFAREFIVTGVNTTLNRLQQKLKPHGSKSATSPVILTQRGMMTLFTLHGEALKILRELRAARGVKFRSDSILQTLNFTA